MKKPIKLTLLFVLGLLLAACGSNAPAAPASIDINDLPLTLDVQEVAELKEMDGVLVVDVREQWEYDEKHIPGVTLIPMSEIENRLTEIPSDREVIFTCRSGNRSGQVTDFLRQQGFDNVHNMEGGIVAWESAGFSVEQ
jgi:rhodanese-related sulfurtransferase